MVFCCLVDGCFLVVICVGIFFVFLVGGRYIFGCWNWVFSDWDVVLCLLWLVICWLCCDCWGEYDVGLLDWWCDVYVWCCWYGWGWCGYSWLVFFGLVFGSCGLSWIFCLLWVVLCCVVGLGGMFFGFWWVLDFLVRIGWMVWVILWVWWFFVELGGGVCCGVDEVCFLLCCGCVLVVWVCVVDSVVYFIVFCVGVYRFVGWCWFCWCCRLLVCWGFCFGCGLFWSCVWWVWWFFWWFFWLFFWWYGCSWVFWCGLFCWVVDIVVCWWFWFWCFIVLCWLWWLWLCWLVCVVNRCYDRNIVMFFWLCWYCVWLVLGINDWLDMMWLIVCVCWWLCCWCLWCWCWFWFLRWWSCG